MDYLVKAAQDGGYGVIFVDNISRAARVENEADVELARAAELLGEASKAAGLTVLIDHHHKKGHGKLEDKSRGGTGLPGACDNNIEMVNVGDWTSRERRLSSRGRLAATIWERTIALSEDGRNYVELECAMQGQSPKERGRLRVLHDLGEDGMTAAEAASVWEVAYNTARNQLDEFVVKGWATSPRATS